MPMAIFRANGRSNTKPCKAAAKQEEGTRKSISRRKVEICLPDSVPDCSTRKYTKPLWVEDFFWMIYYIHNVSVRRFDPFRPLKPSVSNRYNRLWTYQSWHTTNSEPTRISRPPGIHTSWVATTHPKRAGNSVSRAESAKWGAFDASTAEHDPGLPKLVLCKARNWCYHIVTQWCCLVGNDSWLALCSTHGPGEFVSSTIEINKKYKAR